MKKAESIAIPAPFYSRSATYGIVSVTITLCIVITNVVSIFPIILYTVVIVAF